MSYKVFDYSPYICAAGKVIKKGSLQNEFRSFPDYEYANHYLDNAKREKKIRKDIEAGVKSRIPSPETDTVQKAIEPKLEKFRFTEFEDEFFEDLYYQSTKKGRAGYPARLGTKPDYVTNTSRTFGIITEMSEPAYGIIFPNKTPEEVNREQELFHDKYIISHKSYFAAEKIKRYPSDSFNPNGKTFGVYYDVDISGKHMKKMLNDCRIGEREVILNKIQADYYKKNKPKLGTPIKKQGLNNSEGISYGKNTIKAFCPAGCLLQNAPPCTELTELLEAISYIRNYRKKLINKIDFNLKAIEITLHSLDANNSNYLDWESIFNVFTTYNLHFHKERIRLVANHFEFVNDKGKVNLDEFLKLFDNGAPMPKVKYFLNLPPTDPVLCTTYRELAADSKRDRTLYHKQFPAGLIQKSKPMVPVGIGSKADLNSLCDETDVNTCISPSVPCQFGLSHRDYFLPRSKDEIRRIFRNCLKNIDDEKFNNLYKEALQMPTSVCDQVSVEAFKCCLIKFRKQKTVKVLTL